MPPVAHSQLLTRIINTHKDIQQENNTASDNYQNFLKDKLVEVSSAGNLVECQCEANSKLVAACSELRFENDQMQLQVRKLEMQLAEAKEEEESKRSCVSKLEGELGGTKSSRESEFPKMKESILLYKKVSGIKWAYSEDPTVVSGFITDKSYGKLSPFTYNSRDNSHSFIVNSLWNSVEKYSQPFVVDE